MATPVYTSIEDELKKRTYRVQIPESYTPHISQYFVETGTPQFNEQPSGAMSLSFVTLIHIVDMCFKNVEFRIPNLIDAEKMLSTLQVYVRDTTAIRGKDNETDVFLDRCQIAIQKLTNFIRRRKRVNERQLGQVQIRPTNASDILQQIRKLSGGQ